MPKNIYHTTVNVHTTVYCTCVLHEGGECYLVVVDEEGELFLSEESCLSHVHAVLSIEELDH